MSENIVKFQRTTETQSMMRWKVRYHSHVLVGKDKSCILATKIRYKYEEVIQKSVSGTK